jgi:hypothetical protein
MLFAAGGEGVPVALEKAIKKMRGAALRSPANRLICEEKRLPALRKAFLRTDCSKSIRDSHLITERAHDALLANDLSEFFDIRRASIWEAEKQWLLAPLGLWPRLVHQHGGNATFQSDPRKYSKG